LAWVNIDASLFAHAGALGRLFRNLHKAMYYAPHSFSPLPG
jgi:hypothetical protein